MKKMFLSIMIVLAFVLAINTNTYASEKKVFENFKTPNRDFFSNADGTYTDVYYSSVVNFYEDGIYKKIDNSFVENKVGYTNKSSNYKIEAPKKLNEENYIKLDYYSNDIVFAFKNIDEMGSSIIKKNNNSVRNNDAVYSEKIEYSNNKYKIIADNYTDMFKLKIELQSITLLKDMEIILSSENLRLVKKEDSIQAVNKYNGIIFELNKQYLMKTGENYIVKELDFNDGVIVFENESLVRSGETSIELQVSYTINNNSNCISDKYITSGIDYGYDTEFMKVGNNATNEHKVIVGINLNMFSSQLFVYAANLVYYKESGSNINLNIYKINNQIYSDITGVTSYLKTFVDSSNYSNGYNFDLLSAFSNEPTGGDGRYVFEISMDSNSTGTIWLASDDAYEMPYLVLEYEDIANSNYGAALEYEYVSGINMNCFGYALNINANIQLRNQNNEMIFPFNVTDITEEDVINIFVPAVLAEATRQGVLIRQIDSYDSTISDNEYRIAFRVGNVSSDDIVYAPGGAEGLYSLYDEYHFLRQNSDGTWSHKQGQLGSIYLEDIYNPYLFKWYYLYPASPYQLEAHNYFFDSIIYYFAITVD